MFEKQTHTKKNNVTPSNMFLRRKDGDSLKYSFDFDPMRTWNYGGWASTWRTKLKATELKT